MSERAANFVQFIQIDIIDTVNLEWKNEQNNDLNLFKSNWVTSKMSIFDKIWIRWG